MEREIPSDKQVSQAITGERLITFIGLILNFLEWQEVTDDKARCRRDFHQHAPCRLRTKNRGMLLGYGF